MLTDTLKKDAQKIASLWHSEFFSHHTLDSVGVSRTVTDQFLNPVGHIVKEATTQLYKAVIGEDVNQEDIKKQIEDLLKIQAVQQLSPAQALLPIRMIKELIYNAISAQLKTAEDFKVYKEICDRTDTLLLMAFDIYAQDKETLYRIRVNELKSAQSQILRFAQTKGYPAEMIEQIQNF